MPGFMQSIKSHLPQSPFSPTKKNAPALVVPEAVTPAAENVVVEEQPSSEVLPGEALVQHNSSTVALTLTPANGESSQQLTPIDANATDLEEPIHQSDSPPEVESSIPESEALVEPEATTQCTVEEVPVEAAIEAPQPEVSAAETVDVESTPVAEVDASAPETTIVEAEQPQDEVVDDQVAQDAAVPSDELTASNDVSTDVSPAPTEADSAKPAAKAGKETFSSHVKRSKSKKCKSDSPETSDVTESGPSKPRKSHPLAGKFRSVIDQVRSKVKKDKDALITKEDPTTPPAVVVIEPSPVEPTPICAETPVAA